jgi:hypothetical protein
MLLARGHGESTADWFAGISWVNGDGVRDDQRRIPCEGASAWTTPGSTTDYVCQSFTQVAFQGNVLIHEMLHTLGMPECNGYGTDCPSTWKTPQQIDDLVAQYCGAN